MPKLLTGTALVLLPLLCFLSLPSFAQGEEVKDSAALPALPRTLCVFLFQKSAAAEGRLDKAEAKYLAKLLKQEKKLREKLARVDSLKAQQLFADIEEKYAAFKTAPQKPPAYGQVYSGHLDSLATSLNFLTVTGLSFHPELTNALSQFSSLQTKLTQTEAVKKFFTERKRLLQENLERLGMLKEMKGFSKQAYYYSAQLKEVKAIWENPSKPERKLLEWAVTSDGFKTFFRNHSQLASLFALPGRSATTAYLQGLQTRAGVRQSLTARFGSEPNAQRLLQQNLQAAQEQLQELKNKRPQHGAGNVGNSRGSIDVPEGFKPNAQKTRPFLKRLEYGVNLQSQRAKSYFPATSDVGLFLGYKLNDKGSAGLGASYALGWGRGWNHIRMTSEGAGLRSYADYTLGGSLCITGGYELNYRTAFTGIDQLRNRSAWQRSGLIGLSKKYRVSRKVKGDMKLLWDFLSYRQVPQTQAVLFRIGYSLK